MAYTNFTDKICVHSWGKFEMTSAEALKCGDLVTIDGYMADEDDSKAGKYVALEDIASATVGWVAPAGFFRKGATIATGGVVTRGDHSGTAGTVLYLSATDGQASQSAGGSINQHVGVVISQDEIYLAPTEYLTGSSQSITGSITTTTTIAAGTNLTVGGTSTLDNAVACSSALTVASTTTLTKALSCSSAATVTKALTCSSAATVTKTLTCSSAATVTKTLTCSSKATVGLLFTCSSKATMTKAVTCSSAVTIAKTLTCSSTIYYKRPSHDGSSSKTLTAAQTGMVFTNDTDAKVYTLPATSPGILYTFVNIGASTAAEMRITPNASDKIIMSATVATDAHSIKNTKATMDLGDSITLCGDPTGDGWLVIAKTGTWADLGS